MFLIITKYLIPRGFRGITTFFIFIRYPADKENRVFINHENTLAPAIRIISTSLFYMVHFEYLVRSSNIKQIWLIGILVLSVRLTVMKLTLVI
jgi:hypothetical protein